MIDGNFDRLWHEWTDFVSVPVDQFRSADIRNLVTRGPPAEVSHRRCWQPYLGVLAAFLAALFAFFSLGESLGLLDFSFFT